MGSCPPPPPRRLGNPLMKPLTDLEALVQHLAGRAAHPVSHGAPSNDVLLQALSDSSSDSSQLLDEIRRRTRSLLDDRELLDATSSAHGSDVPLDRSSVPPDRTNRTGRPLLRWMAYSTVALSLLLVGGLLARMLDRSGARRTQEQTNQILAMIRAENPTPRRADLSIPAGPTELPHTLSRLEAYVTALNAKVDALSRSVAAIRPTEASARPGAPTNAPAPSAVNLDSGLATLATDLAAIRRELVNSEAATTRQIQEMRTVLHEVNTVVRRVLSRPQTSPASGPSVPILVVTVQALINNLQSPAAQVRGEAVEQLVRIGSPARPAIPALQNRLNVETDSNVRTAIEAAINVLSSN